jgi:hypothetical protein
MKELGKLKKSNDVIGTGARELSARSIAPQPSISQCAPRNAVKLRNKATLVTNKLWDLFLKCTSLVCVLPQISPS